MAVALGISSLIKALSAHPDGRMVLRRCAGVAMLRRCLSCWPNEVQVLGEACAALANLASCSESRSFVEVIVLEGGMEVVMTALNSSSDIVCTSGMQALAKLCAYSDMIHVDAWGGLPPVIKLAHQILLTPTNQPWRRSAPLAALELLVALAECPLYRPRMDRRLVQQYVKIVCDSPADSTPPGILVVELLLRLVQAFGPNALNAERRRLQAHPNFKLPEQMSEKDWKFEKSSEVVRVVPDDIRLGFTFDDMGGGGDLAGLDSCSDDADSDASDQAAFARVQANNTALEAATEPLIGGGAEEEEEEVKDKKGKKKAKKKGKKKKSEWGSMAATKAFEEDTAELQARKKAVKDPTWLTRSKVRWL